MKKIIPAILIAVTLHLSASTVNAQFIFVPDQNGKPLTDAKYENLTGTPFYLDTWTKAEVKLANGEIVKPNEVKYDVVSEKLLFKLEDKIFEFYPKVASFTLITDQGNKTFLIKNESKGSGYFEVLASGKIKLFKRLRKNILETKGYNSAT
ncbi:MAG: hypothetical protein EOO92_13170, partial [Pedobacter sp.]